MMHPDPEQEQERLTPGPDTDALRVMGVCLQSSFSADNHDSLSNEITRLLLYLSHD